MECRRYWYFPDKDKAQHKIWPEVCVDSEITKSSLMDALSGKPKAVTLHIITLLGSLGSP